MLQLSIQSNTNRSRINFSTTLILEIFFFLISFISNSF
ncbi:hypothetical protein LEP1GSC166_2997 [Leptospira kirschneri]|nr:hypothetical protein LEP1GSC166_2997 [Leptospira kirschneri]